MTNNGTNGNDTLQCDDANDPAGGTVRGNGGADTITLSGTTATAQRIRGDAGVDDIQISGGSVVDDVFLGSTNVNSTNDSDTFTITGGGVGRDVRGDAGADTINLDGGTVGRNVRGHGGADVITLDGASVTATIHGDDGNDTIDLLSGSANQVRGGNNNDTITLNGATISGTIRGDGGADTIDLLSGSVSQVRGDGGNDEITVDGATVSGTLNANGGSDTITLSSGSVNQMRGGSGDDTINLLGGSANQVFGNNNNDTITLDGATINTNIRGGNGNDTIDLLSGSANQVLGDNNNDTITLNGAMITTNIRGDNGNDTIDLLSGSVNQVLGGNNDDTITLDGATVTSNLRGDAGVDTITVSDGTIGGAVFLGVTNSTSSESDTFTMTGGAITGGVFGDAGADAITLSDGAADSVDAKGGADVILLDGPAMIANDIIAGAGVDALTISDGTVGGAVFLGLTDFSSSQSDTFTMTGGAITGGVFGDAGDDAITLSDGSADSVDAKGGADVILLDGPAMIANDIIAGAGVDGLTISDGTVGGDVFLGLTDFSSNQSDTFTMTGGAITGGVFGDAGDDAITLSSGSADSVDAKGGADVIQLDGATVATNVRGGSGADMITISDGSVGLGSSTTSTLTILGGGGDDVISWTGGEIGDDAANSVNKGIDGGDGSDSLFVAAADYDGTQTLDGGDDTSSADGFVDTLTLSGFDVSVESGDLIRNWESVTLDGGELDIVDRNLSVGSGSGSGLFLTNGARLRTTGGFALTGNLFNNGVMSSMDGVAGDVVSVSGDYSGSGVVEIDVDFSTDMVDTLKIGGDVTGGATTIVLDDVTTGGATGNDLVVVDVAGSTGAGDFALQGGASVTSGAVIYNFGLDGSQWILTPDAFTGDATLYSAVGAIFLNTTRPTTLSQRSGFRTGFRGASDPASADQPPVSSQNALVFADRPEDRSGPWLRVFGERMEEDLSGSQDVSYESTSGGLQAGLDLEVHSGEYGQVVLGVNGSINLIDADTSSETGDGSVESDAFGLGATATWYSGDGAYADFQAELGWIDSDFGSSTNGTLARSIDSTAYSLSGEVGQRFGVGGGSSLTPQGQLWFASVDTDSFTDSQGNEISFDSSQDVVGRLGLAYDYENVDPGGVRRENLYVIGSVLHNFDGDSSATISGQDLTVSGEDTWGEIAVGGLAKLSETTQVFAEGAYRTAIGDGFGDDFGLSLSAGVRVSW